MNQRSSTSQSKFGANIIIKKSGSEIGQAAAEDDDQFLFSSFVQNDAYNEATDFESPKFILVGRTGAGKTAILRNIENRNENVVRIDPKELTLRYVANSNILQYFRDIGVNLGMFYELLWRHIIATELIKAKYNVTDSGKPINVLDNLMVSVSPKRKRAINYLAKFGSDFWQDADSRVTQVTQTVEAELAARAGIDAKLFKASGDGKVKFSEEAKIEHKQKSQEVIDSIKLQELAEVINWLNEDLYSSEKEKAFLIIDELDQPFASENVKYELIRALIETVKKYKRVTNVRMNIALRADLLEETFERTKDEGFQAEKYEGNINEISWTKDQLLELVKIRINNLLKLKYSSRTKIHFLDLFVDKINSKKSSDYLLDRTMKRPRDIIAFVNECLSKAVGLEKIGATEIRKAEVEYSAKRFQALEYEWNISHPLLEKYVKFLRGQNRRFRIAEIPIDLIKEMQLDLLSSSNADRDYVSVAAVEGGDFDDLVKSEFFFYLLDSLYKVGIISISVNRLRKDSVSGRQHLTRSDVENSTVIYIHPMFWQFLNVRKQ